MHQLDQGIVKDLVRVNFYDAEDCDTVAERKQLNELLFKHKVPSEHDRRPRPAKTLADFKSKDFKLLGLFIFIPVSRVIFGEAEMEKQRIFHLTTFCYRALMAEDAEYDKIERWLYQENRDIAVDVDGEKILLPTRSMQHLLNLWQYMWEDLYGKLDCHYNHHMFHHAAQSRCKTGPLYKTSTEK